jgi:archaeal flagellar protein FlaJ
MVVIPFSFLPPKLLEGFSDKFMNGGAVISKVLPYLQLELDRAGIKIDSKRYAAMCITANLFMFTFLTIVLTIFMLKIKRPFLGILISFVFSLIVFFMQLNYPKVLSGKRIRKLDVDLLASLRAILIQLNSGVPLFEGIVIISNQEFGEISSEFKKAVKEISAGVPQIQAFETMALKNPSPYFRRAIWQMINGMKEGAPIKEVIGQVIKNLTKEQVIQIEKYGSQLNPLVMFYMMIAVILPALGVTFMLILSSFVGLEEFLMKMLFIALLVGVTFFQIMFSGIIKTKRPSLLG